MSQTLAQTPLLEMSFEDLTEALKGPGRAAAVMRAIRQGDIPLESQHLGKRTREAFRKACAFEPPKLDTMEIASDGTLKAVLIFHDQARVEFVIIPTQERSTVCVSSQVGCSRQCQFCMTAEMGMLRQLTLEEILVQVWWAKRLVREHNYPQLRNIVFMGMGEPLDNWNAVEPAINYLVDQRMHGFGARHVTLSTVGPTPDKISKLKGVDSKLAWSLHATSTKERQALIPTQRHCLEELICAFEEVLSERKDSVFLEYTLIAGINDAPNQALEVLELAQRLGPKTRVNLLPVNPGRTNMHPPSDDVCRAFAQTLRDGGVITTLRLARGQDQSAACGQLIQKLKKKRAGDQPARFKIIGAD